MTDEGVDGAGFAAWLETGESPPFTPEDLRVLAARDYRRVNRHAAPREPEPSPAVRPHVWWRCCPKDCAREYCAACLVDRTWTDAQEAGHCPADHR